MGQPPLSDGHHFFAADDVTFHYLVRGSGLILVANSVGWGMPGLVSSGIPSVLSWRSTIVLFISSLAATGKAVTLLMTVP